PVGEHLLQSNGPVTDSAEQKVVHPQKLECEVPPHRLAPLVQRDREHRDVAPDTQCHLAARRISMGKMTVLVCEHRAECALLKTADQSHAQYEDAACDVTPSLTRAPALVHSHLSPRRNTDLVHRSRADGPGHLACELPERWRFDLCE